MSIIYEVNIAVAPELEATYSKWLSQHILEILQIRGFLSARVFRRSASEEPFPPQHSALWTVHYSIASREDLENYFENHAARLRADAQTRFGEKFSIVRRILYPTDDKK